MKYIFVLIAINLFIVDTKAQNEFELNFNTVIPFGDYAKNDLYFGMETIGYAKVGYGVDFKYLHQFKNSKFKLGVGINHLQNPYNRKKLAYAYRNFLGCSGDPFRCSFKIYFGWDTLYKVSDWKHTDLNVYTGYNIVNIKNISYSILIGGGVTLMQGPKYYYGVGLRTTEIEDNHLDLTYNFNTEQNLRIRIIDKLYLNTGVVYRLSKTHLKFTKNLIAQYVYYDFWQHTLSAKIGIIYILNAK